MVIFYNSPANRQSQPIPFDSMSRMYSPEWLENFLRIFGIESCSIILHNYLGKNFSIHPLCLSQGTREYLYSVRYINFAELN